MFVSCRYLGLLATVACVAEAAAASSSGRRGITAFAPSSSPLSVFRSAPRLRQGVNQRGLVTMTAAPLDKRAERRRIVSNPNFNRMGFKDTQEEVQGIMVEEFTSDLVKELRENAYVIERDNVTIKLAKSFGFCWGVERAVAMAYEARTFYKNEKIHVSTRFDHIQATLFFCAFIFIHRTFVFSADYQRDHPQPWSQQPSKAGKSAHLFHSLRNCSRIVYAATHEVTGHPFLKPRLTLRCLSQMGINFINPDKQTGVKDFSVVESGDVVVLPAFGASLEEMQVLTHISLLQGMHVCALVIESLRKTHRDAMHLDTKQDIMMYTSTHKSTCQEYQTEENYGVCTETCKPKYYARERHGQRQRDCIRG
jgi:hypothetical protein